MLYTHLQTIPHHFTRCTTGESAGGGGLLPLNSRGRGDRPCRVKLRGVGVVGPEAGVVGAGVSGVLDGATWEHREHGKHGMHWNAKRGIFGHGRIVHHFQ